MDKSAESHRHWKVMGACFLAVFLAGLAAEIWSAQEETEALAQRLSAEVGRTGNSARITPEAVREALRSLPGRRPLGTVTLFDLQGAQVAEIHFTPPRGREHERRVMVSSRAGVRDLTTGRELFHMVVHKDIQQGLLRPALIGLTVALLAGAAVWLLGRGKEAAPPAAA